MSDETNALLALKNAWTGALTSAEALKTLGPAVAALPPATPLAEVDLDTYHRLTLANANAAQALRGLVEELRRRLGGHGQEHAVGAPAADSD